MIVYPVMRLNVNAKLEYVELAERPSEWALLLELYGNSYRTSWTAPQSDARQR